MRNFCALLFFLVISCNKKENSEIACTMEFRIITVEISGPELDDFYSIQISNGDTLRFDVYTRINNLYPIVDDSFSVKEGIEKRIDFVAIRGDQIRKSPYTFTSDGCHIIKKSGLEVIDF